MNESESAGGGTEFFSLMQALRALKSGPLSDRPSDRVLAKAAGVSPTTIGDWLRGRRFPQELDPLLVMVRLLRDAAEARGIIASVKAPPGLLDDGRWREAYRAEARRRAGVAAGPLLAEAGERAGHAFIAYVREDSGEVDALQHALEAAGVRVWRDSSDLWPGEDWRERIQDAITRNALVFIACFSRHSGARERSYQNEELALAIDQLRLRRPDVPWLIPVRFDDCTIPHHDIGSGRTLASLQRADIFGVQRDAAVTRLVAAVLRILGQSRSVSAADTASQSEPPLRADQASELTADKVTGQAGPGRAPVITGAATGQATGENVPAQDAGSGDQPADRADGEVKADPLVRARRSVITVIKRLPDSIIKAGAVVAAVSTLVGTGFLLFHLLGSRGSANHAGGNPPSPAPAASPSPGAASRNLGVATITSMRLLSKPTTGPHYNVYIHVTRLPPKGYYLWLIALVYPKPGSISETLYFAKAHLHLVAHGQSVEIQYCHPLQRDLQRGLEVVVASVNASRMLTTNRDQENNPATCRNNTDLTSLPGTQLISNIYHFTAAS